MEYAAVKHGQGVPRSRPIAGALQVLAVLTSVMAVSLAALIGTTHGRLKRSPIDSCLRDMQRSLEQIDTALTTYSGKLPVRLLSDTNQTLSLPDGPIPRDVRDFLRSQGSDPDAIEKHDPWGQGYLIDIASTKDGRIRASVTSAGPNGIFESGRHRTAEGDDIVLLHRHETR